MIAFEIAVLGCLVFFLLGVSRLIYQGGSDKVSYSLLASALVMVVWITIAAVSSHSQPCVQVTYHPVMKQRLADGSIIDVIVIEDEVGRTKVVNVNAALGVAVPDDGRDYQVARMKYAGDAWGLFFRPIQKYKILPQ